MHDIINVTAPTIVAQRTIERLEINNSPDMVHNFNDENKLNLIRLVRVMILGSYLAYLP